MEGRKSKAYIRG